MRAPAKYTRLATLLAVGTIAAIGVAHARGWGDDEDQRAQMAELEQLHATFHSAASVHDPVNGDSPTVITQRIRDVLGIWTVPDRVMPALVRFYFCERRLVLEQRNYHGRIGLMLEGILSCSRLSIRVGNL